MSNIERRLRKLEDAKGNVGGRLIVVSVGRNNVEAGTVDALAQAHIVATDQDLVVQLLKFCTEQTPPQARVLSVKPL